MIDSINITLFIQAINFFIAYGMLRIFFFRPIIDALSHEEMTRKLLGQEIADGQTSITYKEEIKHNYWKSTQDYYLTHALSGQSQQFERSNILQNTLRMITIDTLTTEQTEHRIHDVSDALIYKYQSRYKQLQRGKK